MTEPAATPARPLTSATVVADHAARVTRKPGAFVTTLLRSRSTAALDILAHVVTGGRATRDEVVAAAAQGTLRLDEDLDVELLGRLATVLALQGPSPDVPAALAVFAAIEQHVGLGAMTIRDRAVYLQLLSQRRERERLQRLLDDVQLERGARATLLADVANPFLHDDVDGVASGWLSRLTDALGLRGGLDLRGGLEAGEPGTSPFDRLHATSHERVTSSQRVTVITSAYNPDDALVNAARSLVAQSWQNWEMLVVDDASTDPSAEGYLRAVEALDPRIRVIRKGVNGGTYRARNTALMQATGDFVTCLDSDDWAHPDRLVTGLAPMLESDAVIATRSSGARVSEDLELSRPGYRTQFAAASSLMFRVRPVVERIGFFDPVRKGADTEYALRIESAFGRGVVDVDGGALTVLRGLGDTLSASEFSFAWRHPVRWAYKQSYATRHQGIKAAERSPFHEPEEPQPSFGTQRWFRAPDPEYVAHRHLDVVVAGDWRRLGGPQFSMLEEIEALLSEGLSVGVMHLEAMRFFTPRDEPLCAPLRQMLDAGRVSLVHLDDDVDVDLLMLRYPPILQFPPAGRATVRARRFVVVANQAPSEKNGTDQRYVPADVHRHGTELFGLEPRWVPQSPAMREILEPLLPEGALATWDNPAIIDPAAWRITRRRTPGARPVVGRFSRDDVIKFPRTWQELRQAYDLGPDIDVRMMGATSQVRRLSQEAEGPEAKVPSTWTVLPHKAMDVREFLADVDIIVYLDHPDANEAFGRSLLESAASGAVVIASPKHRLTFGDALLYAEPAEVAGLVEQLVADPARIAEQVELTATRINESWVRRAFLDKVLGELATVPRDEAPPVPAAEAGDVVVHAAAPGRLPRVTSSGGLQGHAVAVRRAADGEIFDSLIALAPAGAHVADAVRAVLASHRAGMPVSPVDPLPGDLCGLVWRQDGHWVPQLADGLTWEATGTSCRIASTPRSHDGGREALG